MSSSGDGPLVKDNEGSVRNAELSCSSEERAAPATDSEPPIALDKFIEESGISAVTVWRYRRAGLLRTLNIYGRHYLTRAEIRRFNERAAAGEFARAPSRPRRAKNQK
jgi:hypothetical protein